MEKRQCFACEMDAAYTDVAVMRWQGFTTQDAIHEATGKTFNEMKAEKEEKAA